MIDTQVKYSILERIISSDSFRGADRYKTLLTYLVESSIKGNIPKEYSIAIDVFKKGKDFNPSEDTVVRYYAHRLRQKIKAYYENEGKDDDIRLVIPKGHYEVKFQKRSKVLGKKRRTISPLNAVLSLILIFLLGANIHFYLKYHDLRESSRIIDDPIDLNDPIWSTFFNNKLNTILLIGDHFLYQEYDDQLERFRFIIDHDINIREKFIRFQNDCADRRLVRMDQGSLPLNCIFNLSDLSHVFYSFSKSVNIELTSVYMSSHFDLLKLNDQNVIYIGGFRNLRQFNFIMDKLPVRYKYAEADFWRGEITVEQPQSDSLLTFKSSILEDGRYSDLGLVAKLPGNEEENYLILTGFAYPAQTEIVRMVCRNLCLSTLYEQTKDQYPTFPEFFFMIVEVLGSEYSAMETRLQYFRKLNIE